MKASWLLPVILAFQAQESTTAAGRLRESMESGQQPNDAAKFGSPVAEIPILLERNKVIVPVSAGVRSKQDNADGIPGNNALRRFNVISDYAHKRLHIRTNSHYSEPFNSDRQQGFTIEKTGVHSPGPDRATGGCPS